MKWRLAVFSLISCLLGSFELHAAQSVSLDQAFAHAIHHSESVLIKAAEVRALRQQRRQKIGGLLPTLSFETDFDYASERRDSGGSFGGGIDSWQRQAQLVLNQPLFKGGREYVTLKKSKQEIERSQYDYQVTRNQLYLEIAQAFYEVLQYQRDLQVLRKTQHLLQNRIKELTKRAKIGRSRDSAVMSSRTRLHQIKAEAALKQALSKGARRDFVYLTNLPESTPLKDNKAIDTKSLSALLTDAGQHPEIARASKQVEIGEADKKIALLAHLPTLDLEGRYLLLKPQGFRPSEWSLNVNLTFPLFEGGRTHAAFKESAIRVEQERLDLRQVRKQIDLRIRRYYQLYRGVQQQVKQLKTAAHYAYKSYELEQADYEKSLVSNLDVLDSLEKYLELKQALNQAEFDQKIAYFQLNIAAGHQP